MTPELIGIITVGVALGAVALTSVGLMFSAMKWLADRVDKQFAASEARVDKRFSDFEARVDKRFDATSASTQWTSVSTQWTGVSKW